MSDQAAQLRQIVSQINTDEKMNNKMKVITITSGKGGVGKSNFTTNLSLCLKKLGKKPLILDADFGLANVEIILGERPKYNLSHLLNKKCSIEEIITESKYGIPFISGGSGIKDMLFLSDEQLEDIAVTLAKLEKMADILLIDTGAGINDIVLKFSMIADEVFVIVTPEPASITDAYALIKTIVKDFNSLPNFKLVINKAVSKQEAHEVFSKLSYVANQFLNIKLHYAGYVPYDDKIFQAVKKQKPVVVYDPKTYASIAYEEISKTMVPNEREKMTRVKQNWVHTFKEVFRRK